ncbi:MAG: 3-deoxy-D-manno-octulosonic acid transferase [Flavobacteriia bacterium]|nr:3-deoxy-D-manno-octulosonic acid transferase [Flavobacteriia bacterium]
MVYTVLFHKKRLLHRILMRVLYDTGIRMLGAGIFLLGNCNAKIKRRWKMQQTWEQTLPDCPVDLWMHCASLGEFDQGLPLLWEYRKANPKAIILVSFFSPSGFAHYHKRKHCADFVCVFPLDTRRNARIFLDKTQPKLVLFVKYEFWLNMLFCIKERKIPLYSVASIFRKSQPMFQPWGKIFRKGLQSFSHFFVQNDMSLRLLAQIGIHEVTVVGDPRYDHVLRQKQRVEEEENPDKHMLILQGICERHPTLILGSSWAEEERLLRTCMESLSGWKVILAPHQVEETHLASIHALFGESCIRYSDLENYSQQQVIVIDCIGLLHQIYALGSVAFVGGGFSGKLHNILEPAVYGLPVLFGPKFDKFPEAEAFITAGIGFPIKDAASLLDRIQHCFTNQDILHKKTKQFIESQQGATEKIMVGMASKLSRSDFPSN